ncbi:MAG: ASPIC/UnbV domain-containing protein [Opitutaceae bacterium]|nr:ASPIC/UnbV domain-containing protein [Opitutaceae bacterium]
MKGMLSLLLENQGKGSFASAADKGGPFFQRQLNLRGSGAFDFDNDGRMDLIASSLGDRAVLLHNRGASSGHWLTVKLVGTRSNRDGFGAQVKVVAGARSWQAEARCPTSYVFQQDPRLHFGLGAAATIDRIEIRWPSGQTQTVANPVVDQVVRIQEP